MAVAHDASAVSHVNGSSQSVASFTFSLAGAASGVKAVLVFVHTVGASTAYASAVTYGGTALTAVTGGMAADTVDELASTQAWFLGASVPQGTNDVVVTRTNDGTRVAAMAATCAADTDCETFGVVLEQENQALTEQAVDDGSPGTNSLRYASTIFGSNAQAGLVVGASSTGLQVNDMGTMVVGMVRETTGGQGSRSLGWDTVSDDVAAVYFAVREIPAAGGTTWPGFVGPFGWS